MITIEQIKAECRKAIEFGKEATTVPWVAMKSKTALYGGFDVRCQKGRCIASMDSRGCADSPETMDANARHIAHARTFSPAAARVVLGMIDLLEDMATGDGLMGSMARIKLAEIKGQWEGQS